MVCRAIPPFKKFVTISLFLTLAFFTMKFCSRFRKASLSALFNYSRTYTQAEQEAIVSARSEAAAQKILQIKNNTHAAIAKLVNYFKKKLVALLNERY